MKALRSLCLALALVAGAPALVTVEAHAADVFAEKGLVELLPAGPVVAGQPAVLHVVARNADGSPMTGLILKVSATSGSVGSWQAVSDGLYSLSFTPAPAKDPTRVTLTGKGKTVSLTGVIDVLPAPTVELEANPERMILGKDTETTLTVSGPEVELRTSSGQLKGGKLEAPKVNIPQTAIVTAGEQHLLVPMHGSVDYPVRGPAGAKISLEIGERTFGPVTADADGKAKVQIEVPPGVQEGVQVTVDGDDETRKTLDLRIPETRHVALFPVPPTVPAGADVPLRAVVLTSSADPETANAPAFDVSSGTVAAPKHLGEGVWEALWTPAAAGKATVKLDGGTEVQQDSLEVDVVAAFPDSLETDPAPSQGEPWAVVVIPERTVAGAEEEVELLVAAIDAFGLPVAEAEVALKGGLETTASTGPTGIARIPYTAGSEPGLVRFRATSGDAVGAGALVLASKAVGALAIPASGDEQVAAVVQRWIDAMPETEAPVEKPKVALVELSTEATGVKPGDTVVITVARVLDLEGIEVPGYVPDLVTSTGSTAPIAKVNEDGTTTIEWTLPEDAPAEVELFAMSGGSEVGKLAIEVEGGAVADAGETPWGAAEPEPEPAPEPEPEPEPEPQPTPRGDDFKWLRARVSGVGSTYRYEQSPSEQPGPLLPSTLAVGGPSGGSAASPLGAELDLRTWGDAVSAPYVGLHGQFRFTGYSIEAAAFNGVASDMLYNAELDVLARYPFEAAGDRYWVGGKVGYHYNDFLLFSGCLEPGCEISFDAIGVSGLGLGAEVGAEIGDLFLIGGYTAGLASATELYSHAVDVDLGYGFLDYLFADLGFSVLTRSVVLEGETTELERGAIHDSQMMVKLGAGVAF